MPAQAVTVTANFERIIFNLEGVVKDSDNKKVPDATVLLKRGKQVIQETTTDANGAYSFTGLKNAVYNLVVTKGEKMVTTLVIIKNADVTQAVVLPADQRSSILEVNGEDTPAVVVGGLDKIAQDDKDSNIVIKMIVEKKEETQASNAKEIKKTVLGKSVKFMDMKVIKLSGGTEQMKTELEKVLEIVIPYDFTDKFNFKVYRYHGTAVNTFAKLEEKPSEPYTDGTYYLDEANGFIYVYTKKFSTYAIAYQTAEQKNITFDANGGSVVTSTMLTGTNGKLETLPNCTRSGYCFAGWYTAASDGTKVTTDTVFTGDATVYAQWRKASSGGGSSHGYYTITVRQTEGGTISPSTVSVRKNHDKTFTIKADQGYYISDVLVDGTSVGAVSRYTLKKIDENHTLKAVFVRESDTKDEPFTDVRQEDWFYDAVLRVSERGLMTGTSEKCFSPYVGTSRSMIATILHRLENKPEYKQNSPFHDVLENEWYTDGIAWCAQQGIDKGYGEGNFKPNQIITREELCAILYRYAEYKGLDMTKEANLSAFVDKNQIADWANNSMGFALKTELMQGNDHQQIQPKKHATRAEVATVIFNLLQLIES